MNPPPESPDPLVFSQSTESSGRLPVDRKKVGFWQKLGGGSLSVSILFHCVLLVIGLFWIFKIIPPPPEKKVDFMPPSGGGGTPSSDTKSAQRRALMVRPNMPRVAALGATSNLVLPEPDEASRMTNMTSLSSGGLSAGLGGNGSGGGRGNGRGTGVGNGMGAGMGGGNGLKNPFGMFERINSALEGTFYDFKQTRDLKPLEVTEASVREELREIVKKGFKDRDLEKFFKSPRTLYQNKCFIPTMSADRAPAAFEVDQYVRPKFWCVVYRGSVQAPKTGKFRFVGSGDDVLVVRFNNRLMFDHGYILASTGGGWQAASQENYDRDRNSDEIKNFKKLSPMPVPMRSYKYSSTGTVNREINGLAIGPEFEVQAGKTYPVEILISEIPGGLFSTYLLIQEEGVEYKKDPAGCPILPIFRLDNSQPDPSLKGEAPPYDPNGPVWKGVSGGPRRDI